MTFIRDGKGFCPWCKQAVAFKAERAYRPISPYFIISSGRPSSVQEKGDEESVSYSLTVYECLFCTRTSIVLGRRFRTEGQTAWSDEEQTLIAPEQSPRRLDSLVPSAIQDLYEEASKCEIAGALRGAGVLYRASIEELVKDRGGKGNTLYDKIGSLSGSLPEELIRDLHEVRLLGNTSIHSGITYASEEVEDVANLIEEMTVILYVHPEQRRVMRESRKARRSRV